MNNNPLRRLTATNKSAAAVMAATAFVIALTGCGSDEANHKQTTLPTTGEIAAPTDASATAATLDNLHTLLLAGDYHSIYAAFSDEFKQYISEADFQRTGEQALANIKTLEQVSTMQLNGISMRNWISDSKELGVTVTLDSEGLITGLQLQDAAEPDNVENKPTRNEYAVPFQGDWFVFWGGENVLVNYHYAVEGQRFAYDLIQVKDGYSYFGDPLKNESYYAFGQKILAPADGTVVSVVNDIPDNEPVGVMNEKQPAGNAVVIDHGGEFSTLAHLKQGSVSVKIGDKIKAAM
jgi:hypothetical protein